MSSLKDAIVLELHKKAFRAKVLRSLGGIAKKFSTGAKSGVSRTIKTLGGGNPISQGARKMNPIGQGPTL